MTTYRPGQSVTLTAEWRMYAGGPLVPVTGVTITVVNAVSGAVALAPTSTGITTPATGFNVYPWTLPLIPGTYLATWSGTDADGDTVYATELLEVPTPADLYVDLATVKNALTKLTVDDRDELIEGSIRAACRLIDRRTGRYFYSDTTPSARTVPVVGQSMYYHGDQVILVPDIATEDGLAVSTGSTGNWTPVTGWETGPDNALAFGRPITEIRAALGWLPATGRIQVTAVWGWPAVPDEIAEAAKLLATRLYRRKDSPQGVLGSSEWGTARVSRTDPDVEALIAPFVIPVIA